MNEYIKKKDIRIKLRGDKEIFLSKLHEEILSIMDEIDRICRKYDITYGLIAGSALGAVNYGGFIPWDDDIDIFILRSDWDKFIAALDKELNNDFYYHCYEKDTRYNILVPQMKIRKKNTYVEERNILLDNRCCGNGIFVDVVTYGDINNNKFIDEVFRTFIKILTIPIVFIDNLGFNPSLLKKIALFIEKKYSGLSKNSKYMSQPILIPWEKFMKEPVFLKEDILPVKEYMFEGRSYYSYNNIEKVLKKWYGNNCLKKYNEKIQTYEETLPLEKRTSKHMKDIEFSSDSPKTNVKKRLDIFVKLLCYLFLFFILSLFLNYQISLLLVVIIFVASLFVKRG